MGDRVGDGYGARTVQLLLTNARVIDPESGLDARRNVGIGEGTITYVGTDIPPAGRTVDVGGHVVAPGFIDLHSHAQTVNGLRLQALDGVTTSLDLEAGAMPVAAAYEAAVAEGRPINFGYSTNWLRTRVSELDGADLDQPGARLENGIGMAAQQATDHWANPAEPVQVDWLLRRLEQGIREGGIGIGVLAGYAPNSGRKEMLRMGRLAAGLNVPLFVHGRYAGTEDPQSGVEGALELIAVAAATGCAVHMCHINSTYARSIDLIGDAVRNAQDLGIRITTEAYPYTSSSTSIGAAFLAPEELGRRNVKPESIRYLKTGERVADERRLAELRAEDPGGTVVLDYLDPNNPDELGMLHTCVTFPDAAVASDAMLLQVEGRKAGDDIENGWPLPAGAFAHPRSAGCFSRVIGHIARDLGLMSLHDALRRCTLVPATILADAVPAMRRKGRVQVGCDADLTVFDPDRILDQATFEEIRPSTGIDHVIVGGEFVVRGGELLPEAMPGKPVRSEVAVSAPVPT